MNNLHKKLLKYWIVCFGMEECEKVGQTVFLIFLVL